MKEKTLYILKICGIFVLCLCILAVVTLPEIYKQYTYDQAEILIVQEKYEEALANLKKIESKNIKDTKSLINLCEAHIAYSENDLAMAWFKLSYVSLHNQTNAQKEKVEAFKETVNEKFNKYIAEETKKEEKERKKKIISKVPFVGMSESEIEYTSLGKPSSKVRHNKQRINGKAYTANLYDFKVGTKIIFTAICVRGKVTEVWDKRNEQKNTYIPSKKKKIDSNDDPYNANEYSDAEDFYDDYYDDFYDFEDAEDYYNEHTD